MTKWPEPVAIRYLPSIIFPDVVLKPYEVGVVERVNTFIDTPVDLLYTADQVRSIVRAEMETARILIQATVSSLDDTLEDSVAILNELLLHAGWDRFDRQIARQRSTIDKANATLFDARKWLKENKDAD